MLNFCLFLGIGSLLLFLILHIDKQQRLRFKVMLKMGVNVQPLFLMQSAGRKLTMLQAVLAKVENSNVQAQGYSTHHSVTMQLNEAVAAYQDGRLPVDAYHSKLDDMINTINGHYQQVH